MPSRSLLKEIKDQPQVLSNTLSRYLSPGLAVKMNQPPLDSKTIETLRHVQVVACGASYHAGLLARRLIEELAGLPVSVEQASEFRLRRQLLGPHTLVLAISQSGRTIDTLAALEQAKERGARTLALVDAQPSPLAEAAEGFLASLAGHEKSPSSTKAFTAQVLLIILLAVRLAQARQESRALCQETLNALGWAPELTRHALAAEAQAREVADRIKEVDGLFCLARGRALPLALEGALKFREMSRLPAWGYAAGEVWCGLLPLMSPRRPVVFLAFQDEHQEDNLALARVVKDRGVPLYLITEGANADLTALADLTVPLPLAPEMLRPLVGAPPWQLLAYHAADLRGLTG